MANKKVTAKQAREKRIARHNPPALFPNSASASKPPLVAEDLSPAELRSHAAAMGRAARQVQGQVLNRGKRNEVQVTKVATNFQPEAIGERYSKILDQADADAVAATQSTGQFHIPYNSLWYHDHRADMARISEDTGISLDKVVAVGAVISPQNDPKRTELPGARRISEIAAGVDTDVDVSDAASKHIVGVQTKPSARNSQRRDTPVTVPRGQVDLTKLNSDQVAIIGSVSGATFSENPKQGVTPRESLIYGADFSKGKKVHPDLESMRPLGGVRNRRAVTTALEIARGNTTWDEATPSPASKTVEPGRVDQPAKITSYNQSIMSSDQFAKNSEAYNHLVRLHGEGDMQYKLPFGNVPSAAQDFWQKEAALGAEYDKPNPGKPASAAWDAAITQGSVQTPDLTIDQRTHAVLNEGQRVANRNRSSTLHSDQAIVWGGIRNPNTTGERAAPDLAPEDSVADFLNERARVRGEGAPKSADKPDDKPKQETDPNQGTLF